MWIKATVIIINVAFIHITTAIFHYSTKSFKEKPQNVTDMRWPDRTIVREEVHDLAEFWTVIDALLFVNWSERQDYYSTTAFPHFEFFKQYTASSQLSTQQVISTQ